MGNPMTPHHRRSIRLKGYDYASEGLYFITLCTHKRVCLFGEIIDGKMIVNPLGAIVEEEWLKTIELRPNTRLGEFVVMPNHFHAILEIKETVKKGTQATQSTSKLTSPSQTIGAIIRGFKGATTTKIKILLSDQTIAGEARAYNDTIGSVRAYNYTIEPDTNQVRAYCNTPQGPTPQPQPYSIWQRNYWEHIIRDQGAYERISRYIINNPAKWQEDQLRRNDPTDTSVP